VNKARSPEGRAGFGRKRSLLVPSAERLRWITGSHIAGYLENKNGDPRLVSFGLTTLFVYAPGFFFGVKFPAF